MAKHKKTKRQKVLTDLHRQIALTREQLQVSEPQLKEKTEKIESKVTYKPQAQNTNISRTPNLQSFVLQDLRKTAVVTGGIVVLQLILFILVANHVFPFVNY